MGQLVSMLYAILVAKIESIHRFNLILEDNPREFILFIKNIGHLPSVKTSMHLMGCLHLFLLDLPEESELLDKLQDTVLPG
jgi:hypothetical protein